MTELFDPGNLVLKGEQVTLRPLQESDAEALAAATAESREHYRWSPVPNGVEAMRAYIRNTLTLRQRGQRYPFCTVWNGRPVGVTSFLEYQPWSWPAGHSQQRTNAPDAAEIGGTWLAYSAQHTRCNTEAKFLMLSHAFDVWHVHRISLRTDERNARSRRAIERLGAKFEGVRRAERPGEDGSIRSSAFYSIIADEWPTVSAQLREKLSAVRSL
jgi:N-acetyltransferase